MKGKKASLMLISCIILLNNISGVFASNRNAPFTFSNIEALKKYEELNNKNSYSRNTTRGAKTTSDNFQDIIENSNSNDSIKDVELFSSSNNTDESQISYNIETNQYILSEYDKNTDTLLVAIDESKYIFEQVGENIVMTNQSGEQRIVSEMIYDDKAMTNDYKNIEEINSNDAQTRAAGYTRNYGPFYKTNKSWITVLSLVSKVTKMFKFAHPVLGTISLITNGVSKAGDRMIKTMYIRYYQSFLLSKLTYTREEQKWYADSNYKTFVKNRVISFDSVRPGY